MEEKLSKVFEEKLSDRRDYLEMIAQIRGKSDNLYEKMVQAGETRVDALYVDKENPNSKHQKERKSPDHQNNQKDVQTNFRRTKSQRGSKKGGQKGANNVNKCDNNLTQEKDFVREDEEVVALSWAYKTLKEDIKRRKDKQKKSKKIDLKKMQKMQAYLAFKQDLEERSKPEVEPKCWNVTDNTPENKDLEEEKKVKEGDLKESVAEKKKRMKNIATANSIVSFMLGSANPVENTELPEVVKEEGEEPINDQAHEKVENNEDATTIEEQNDHKQSQKVIHMNENQGDDAQKIIDRIMPKRDIKGLKNEKLKINQVAKQKEENLGVSNGKMFCIFVLFLNLQIYQRIF